MSVNVISLSRHQQQRIGGVDALLHSFAKRRRPEDDVYWLKENAEILNILECTKQKVSSQALETYEDFYSELPNRMAFFPQYYRFFTSIALDLEALGVTGNYAEQLCEQVCAQGLHNAELSDLQRAEAMRLLARRGHSIEGSAALRGRLHSFINHSQTFALPNRKAAYELTHIVFYLSKYGRRDPQISPRAVQSLIFTGLIAFLEENADLLAEVCVALRYAGETPPQVWEDWIKVQTRAFQITQQDEGAGDQYHEYLVSNWACATMGVPVFDGHYATSGTGFYSAVQPLGALGALSEILLHWQGARSANWEVMQHRVFTSLPDVLVSHLFDVVNSTDEFSAFFQYFARASGHFGQQKSAPRLERVT